jgi:hypothetical protein
MLNSVSVLGRVPITPDARMRQGSVPLFTGLSQQSLEYSPNQVQPWADSLVCSSFRFMFVDSTGSFHVNRETETTGCFAISIGFGSCSQWAPCPPAEISATGLSLSGRNDNGTSELRAS